MFGVTRKKYIKPFYLAKSARKAPHIDLKAKYWVNLEKSCIISIVIIILFFNLYPRYNSYKNNSLERDVSMLEVIDIPLIKKEEPPPPPPVKTIEPMKIVKIKEENVEDTNLKDEIKAEDLKLDLADDKELLLADSQLGDIASVDFTGRSFSFETGSSFNLDYKKSRLISNDGTSLALDLPDANISKKNTEKSIDLDTKSILERNKPKKKPKPVQNSGLEKIVNINKNQFLLKESESTIGTEEFKTWNRINSALDRLNKDRYGELPKNVKRSSNGLTVSFAYKNGGQHDIFWTKGGKVIIRVTGKQPNDQIYELRKAYDALLQLIYKLNASAS